MKIGLLGILTLSLLGGNAPLWWGIALLVLGMITAFVGGLYALMEHNIQRLLAYHTLENIGIILLGLGAGVTGIALEQPALIALGLVGGLYHLLNHSLFKSVLFLGAGSVWFRTGHRDIEKLGGIGKKMPVISIAMLVGLMAMAALPPLNGFAGEWVIYQSFFKLSNSGAFVARLRAAARRGAGNYRCAGGDVYGESLWRYFPWRAAYQRGRKRHLCAAPDERKRSGTGDLLRNWRCCCAVATADALCCCTSAAGAC